MDMLEEETSVNNLNTTHRFLIPILFSDPPCLYIGTIPAGLTQMNILVL